MASSERITQVQEAILTHLKTIGPRDWDEIQKDFLDIPTSSFWRYVKKAKEQLEKTVTADVAPDLFVGDDSAVELAEPWDKPKMNSIFRLLSHTTRFYELHSDLLALRQHALDSEGKIRDPQLFAKTIRLRNQILNDELSVADGIGRTDFNTQFFDTVIETIAKASPEIAKAIMISLHNLNQEIGTPKQHQAR